MNVVCFAVERESREIVGYAAAAVGAAAVAAVGVQVGAAAQIA